jgi:hypothetical protein
MINVKNLNRRCIEPNCKKIAYYNIENKKGIYCTTHKKDKMVNVYDNKCKIEGCNKIASYNIPTDKIRLYCSNHKKDGMINHRDRKCTEPNCSTYPVYNYKDNKCGIYCKEHKKDGMIDVKNKSKCIECSKHAVFNYQLESKAIYCKEHKKDGMIDIKNKKCKEEGCYTTPVYNYEGTKGGLYCKTHKKDIMVDVINKKCITPLCDRYIINKNKSEYCTRCYSYMYPNTTVSRNYRTKETEVVNYIINLLPDVTIVCNKQIDNGCSNRRPDILIDLGYQVIIIEIDEYQHQSYECICENKRIMEISKDLNHRPIIFIRFNPDSYNINNKKIKSCWGTTKTGLLKIINSNEWNDRLDALKTQLLYWIDNKTDKTIETIQLFYNH